MSEEFKLAAEVKLKRRLKNLQRIDEKREIDQTFISCAEYQLFLDEMRAEKKFRQPDHWTEFRFPKGSALQPITGVRAEDAQKFCNWLSKKENKKYRCPTLAEAQEFSAVENHQFATWCGDEIHSKYYVWNEWNLQWNSPKTEQDLGLRLRQLFEESWIMQYTDLGGLGSLDSALAYVLAIARARASIIVEGMLIDLITSTLALILAIPIASTLDLTHDFEHDFAPTLDLDLARSPALDRTLAHYLSYDFLNFDSDYDLTNLTLDLARNLVPNDETLQNFLKNQDFPAALNYLRELQLTNIVEQRRRNLLIELLSILTTDNFIEQRQAWRRYIHYLIEYAMIGYEMLEKEKRSVWQRLLFWREVRNYAKEKETMAKLYAWTKVVEARQKGELPAWEGIRIVRERDV
jgi:hypothetical protein